MICEGCEDLMSGFLMGLGLAPLIAIGILFVLFLAAGVYVYFAFAWMAVGKKLKYEYPWLAWIPFARDAMVLQMGGFHWSWVFLFLVPVLGWIALFIMGIIAKWRIFEERKYPGWLSLFILIPQLGFVAHAIILGFVAWNDKK